MIIDWLPETDDRPIRPDLPWLRNLSWTKIHASQIGFLTGLLVYWGRKLGKQGMAYGLVILLAHIAFTDYQKLSPHSSCDHRLGVHDIRDKPWYTMSAGILTYFLARWITNPIRLP